MGWLLDLKPLYLAVESKAAVRSEERIQKLIETLPGTLCGSRTSLERLLLSRGTIYCLEEPLGTIRIQFDVDVDEDMKAKNMEANYNEEHGSQL